MHYLIAGLPKSGTTILFSRLAASLPVPLETYFEPDDDTELNTILATSEAPNSLTKILVGRVSAAQRVLSDFDKHVLIIRDPRDQFVSMLLYLFFDFQKSGDAVGYRHARRSLELKLADPDKVSTIALYNEIANAVGRAPVEVFGRLQSVQREYMQAFEPYQQSYESFIDGDLHGLESYLGVILDSEAEVAPEFARVSRSRGYGEWQGWLNDEDRAYADQHWGSFIAELGYPSADDGPVPGICHQTSLDYVAQFKPETS